MPGPATGFAQTAAAKLNLYLHVTGRRNDGYHLLDSLVAFADFGDVIRVRPASGLTLRLSGPFADDTPAGPDNLVIRAAETLRHRYDIADGAQISLQKNLPVASGLGGGSADAAATLRALCRLWGISVEPTSLASLALGLGADLPVCLASAPSMLSGIGETITPAPPLPACPLVLMNPRTPLATQAVFDARRGDFRKPAPLIAPSSNVVDLARRLKQRTNDLYQTARRLLPEIDQGLGLLADQPGCLIARMSGSGASLFGLFSTDSEANRAVERLSAQLPSWWLASGRLLSRDEGRTQAPP